jgi:hypothetical protein
MISVWMNQSLYWARKTTAENEKRDQEDAMKWAKSLSVTGQPILVLKGKLVIWTARANNPERLS